jgi:hypothetical protein
MTHGVGPRSTDRIIFRLSVDIFHLSFLLKVELMVRETSVVSSFVQDTSQFIDYK